MRIFFIISFLCLTSNSWSQKVKETYFDEFWQPTKKDQAFYFRHTQKKKNGTYLVKDFFMSGQLQMEGHFIDKKLEVKEGPFSYYDSQGNISSRVFYVDDNRHGSYTSFYPTGQIKTLENYNQGLRIKEYKEYYADGQERASANFYFGKLRGDCERYHKDGTLQLRMDIEEDGSGILRSYYANGDIHVKGDFELGKREGDWAYFRRGKDLAKKEICSGGSYAERLVNEGKGHLIEEDLVGQFFNGYEFGCNEIENVVFYPDSVAQFIGGKEAMQQFISENVLYPPSAVKNNASGQVYLSFIVEVDGSISHIRVDRGSTFFNKEAVRLVSSMPKWTPAEKDGVKVKTRCRLPINFSID